MDEGYSIKILIEYSWSPRMGRTGEPAIMLARESAKE
jgi:hypothetical protein